MTIQTNFPAAKPSLLLDFAGTKQLDPRITFVRTTTATYYDGYTTAKAEENLLVRSQDFSTIWSLERVTVTADSVAAPDGTTTADTITNTTATGGHVIQQSASTSGYSIVSGLPYTISVFAKKNTNNFLQITVYSASNTLGTGRANFDLQNGSAGTVDGGTSTITSAGNGWYRCSYTVTASASGTVTIYFGLITSSTAARFESYTGLGTESVYLWGAQVEQRSAVTAYTATRLTTYIPVLQTAAAGVARFDHNPVTRESLGLLVEEARTNSVTYSADFTNAAWLRTSCGITSNTIVAPDGNLTGDKIVEDTTASTHLIEQYSITVVSGTTYTCSFYLKAAERTKARVVYLASGSGVYADADLSAGTIGAATAFNTATAVSSSIQSVGNGWYRCTVIGSQSASTNGGVRVEILDASGNRTYTGDGYSGIYIWGAQLEAGAFATSYIPTVASTVTRNADAVSMTYSNFTSWYNAGEGTLYVDGATFANADLSRTFLYIDNTTASNRIMINRAITSRINVFTVTVNGVSQADMANGSATSDGSFSKLCGAYKVNDFAFSYNATSASTDTSGTVPVVTQMLLGSSLASTNMLNGTIRKLAYYPVRLTNAQLQALTS